MKKIVEVEMIAKNQDFDHLWDVIFSSQDKTIMVQIQKLHFDELPSIGAEFELTLEEKKEPEGSCWA